MIVHLLCLSWIRIRIFKAAGSGSGSIFRKTAGSGFAKNECGSTALMPVIWIYTRYNPDPGIQNLNK